MKLTIYVCDSCGTRFDELTPYKLTAVSVGSRNQRTGGICESCFGALKINWTEQPRRGRKPGK